MKVYTTNWYLYKTHFNVISGTEKPRTETNVTGRIRNVTLQSKNGKR